MNSQHVAYEKLIAFAAGELDSTNAKAVVSHTTFCTECSKIVTSFKTIRRLVQTDQGQDPPLETIARTYAIFQARGNSQHPAYENLISFAAGDLDTTEASAIATHTTSCTECSKTITRFKTIRSVIRTEFGQVPPPAIVARAYAIVAKARPAPMPFWQRVGSFVPLPSARQFSMALVLVLLVLSNVVVFTGIGVVATAQDAIPGDSSYSAKLAIENIQLATTLDTAGKLMRRLTYAGYRLDETAALVKLNRVAEIPNTLAAFEKEVNQVSITFKILARENFKRAQELAPQIESTLTGYSTKLDDLRESATEVVKPVLERAIQVSNAAQVNVHETSIQPPSAFPPVGSSPAPAVTQPVASTPAPAVTEPAATSTPRSVPTKPAVIYPPTSVPTQPAAINPPASVPTKPAVISPPTPTRVIVVPTSPPRPSPAPTDTPRPTERPRPTVRPWPTVRPHATEISPGQAKKTPSPGPSD